MVLHRLPEESGFISIEDIVKITFIKSLLHSDLLIINIGEID